MDTGEAEARAGEFIKQRHPRVERIFFRTVYKEGDVWVLHGEVQFKRAYFFTFVRSFKLQIDTNTRDVVFYEEAHLQQFNDILQKL